MDFRFGTGYCAAGFFADSDLLHRCWQPLPWQRDSYAFADNEGQNCLHATLAGYMQGCSWIHFGNFPWLLLWFCGLPSSLLADHVDPVRHTLSRVETRIVDDARTREDSLSR